MEILDYIKEFAKTGVLNFFKGIEKEITKMVLKRLKRFERYLMRQFVSISLILIAIVFLGISLCFLLIEYFNVSKTIAFAAIGIVILLTGIILKIR